MLHTQTFWLAASPEREGADNMTSHNVATTSAKGERQSTTNGVYNRSSGEDERGSSGSGSTDSGSNSYTSHDSKSEVEGGFSVAWTADGSQTIPSPPENSPQAKVAFDSHQPDVYRQGSQAQRDQCDHLSMKCLGYSSSEAVEFTANDHCPPHGSVSVCGLRREMEDAVVSIPSLLSLPCDTYNCDCGMPRFSFFAVFDGHGGSQAAEYCADRLHHMLAEEMTAVMKNVNPVGPVPDNWELKWKKALSTCFSRIDAEVGGICWKGGECGKPVGSAKCCTGPIVPESVGSTAVVAVVSSCQLIIANCGDSRAVLSRGGHAIALSDDHKPNREDEMARIEAAGGRVINWNGYRVLGVLAMSRAIGDWYLKDFVIAEPEVTCTQRTERDECLILASDGLWDVLPNEEVCDIARKYLAYRHSRNDVSAEFRSNEEMEESPAAGAAALLAKIAIGRGSSDNISIVVVDLMARPKR